MQPRLSKPFDIKLALRKLNFVHQQDPHGISAGSLTQQAARVRKFINAKTTKRYKALVAGPPGTGKAFLGLLYKDSTKSAVYEVDLSKVISKYIGETEKNLDRLFVHAEEKDWILFFDEADALFGKRTSVKDAHDKYANIEIAYLKQRIESFSGIVIVAVNNSDDMDGDWKDRFDARVRT